MRSAVTAIASCLIASRDAGPVAERQHSLGRALAQLSRQDRMLEVEVDNGDIAALDVFQGQLFGKADLDALRHDLGDVDGAHQRVLSQFRCLVVAGLGKQNRHDRGGIEHKHAHSLSSSGGKPCCLRQAFASSVSRRASARRSAISSSTTLTPGRLNFWATAWTASERHLRRDDPELSVDDLRSHGVPGLHHHRRAHLRRDDDASASPIFSLACPTDARSAGAFRMLRVFRKAFLRSASMLILSSIRRQYAILTNEWQYRADMTLVCRYPSAMISRPISQRRISLVPAPIS